MRRVVRRGGRRLRARDRSRRVQVARRASRFRGDIPEVAHLRAERPVDAVSHGGPQRPAQGLNRLRELAELLGHVPDAPLLVRGALVLRLNELHEHVLELGTGRRRGTSGEAASEEVSRQREGWRFSSRSRTERMCREPPTIATRAGRAMRWKSTYRYHRVRHGAGPMPCAPRAEDAGDSDARDRID